MNNMIGGRGRKAPYQTSVIRVPSDLVPIIDELSNHYRMSAISGDSTQTSNNVISAISIIRVSYHDVLKESTKILKSRKSASESISRLLKFIYGVEISADDLKSGKIADIDD